MLVKRLFISNTLYTIEIYLNKLYFFIDFVQNITGTFTSSKMQTCLRNLHAEEVQRRKRMSSRENRAVFTNTTPIATATTTTPLIKSTTNTPSTNSTITSSQPLSGSFHSKLTQPPSIQSNHLISSQKNSYTPLQASNSIISSSQYRASNSCITISRKLDFSDTINSISAANHVLNENEETTEFNPYQLD